MMIKIKKGLIILLNVILILSVSGCALKKEANANIKNSSIKIQYLGQSAFVFTGGDGTKIGIDFWNKGAFPYAEDVPSELGITAEDGLTELLISHTHPDHNYVPFKVDTINGIEDGKVNENPEVAKVGDTVISRYASQHFDSSVVTGVTDNAVFLINMDGIKMAHMGDAFGTMGDKKSLEKLKEKIGDIDILFMPIGSANLTAVDSATLKTTLEVMKPRVTVPIHYWKVSDKEQFLSDLKKDSYKVENVNSNLKTVTTNDLPAVDAKVIWNMTAGKYSK